MKCPQAGDFPRLLYILGFGNNDSVKGSFRYGGFVKQKNVISGQGGTRTHTYFYARF